MEESKRQRELETKIESCVSGSKLKITVKIVSTWPEMSIAEKKQGKHQQLENAHSTRAKRWRFYRDIIIIENAAKDQPSVQEWSSET